mmetsp:Transcript_19469/g.21653  ORF Transcript_19469/g.21653 Transcript_19469/m.21653 type:complete len:251 (+) Transcript_19469:43-795(+)
MAENNTWHLIDKACQQICVSLAKLVGIICDEYDSLINSDQVTLNGFLEAYKVVSAGLDVIKQTINSDHQFKEEAETLIRWVEEFYNYLQKVVHAMNQPHQKIIDYLHHQVQEIRQYVTLLVEKLHELDAMGAQNDHTGTDQAGFYHPLPQRAQQATQPVGSDARMRTLMDILLTEREYTRNLEIVLTHYINPLKENAKKIGLSKDDISKVFDSFEVVLPLAERIKTQLEAALGCQNYNIGLFSSVCSKRI